MSPETDTLEVLAPETDASEMGSTETLAPETDSPTPETKYGERQIVTGELTTFPNPRPGRPYHIQISLPEFTCKCPFSGYPDFATIHIDYVPDQTIVELKALKLYINGYRDRYISHEESVNQILDDFVAACDPLSASIQGDFNPRGNVHTVVEVTHTKPDLPESAATKPTATKSAAKSAAKGSASKSTPSKSGAKDSSSKKDKSKKKSKG